MFKTLKSTMFPTLKTIQLVRNKLFVYHSVLSNCITDLVKTFFFKITLTKN